MLSIALALVIGYLLGSIPFGLVLTRAAGLGDVRSIGSGNIGATNVLRTGNKKLAAATLLLDGLKGTAAVLIGWHLAAWLGSNLDALSAIPANPSSGYVVTKAQAQLPQHVASLAGGLGAFLGHVFPVWLGFKGGKGVATYIGILLGLFWPAAAVFALAWIATAIVTRFSSLSALVATLVVFLYLAAKGGPYVVPVAAILSALLFWKHRENIQRLLAGTESRIGAKK